MSDKILLTGIEIFGHHGCSEEEQQRGQVFITDIELGLDLSKAGKSDEISDTVDYAAVMEEIKKIVGGKPRKLIETVAEEIAETLLQNFPLLENVKVKIRKPSAELIGIFEHAAVEIFRSRK